MLLCLLLTITAALLVLVVVLREKASRTPSYHYEMSKELRLSFSNADLVIQEIREALERHDYRIYIRYQASDGYMNDVMPLVNELMTWAVADTDSPTQGDYIRYQMGGYDVNYSRTDLEDGSANYLITITPVYYTKTAQEAAVDQDVEEILQEVDIDCCSSDLEKVEAIYDYVYSHVKYDSIHKSSEYHLKSTAYAALERGIAGCQGYAVAMYRLLEEAGVDCRVITGMAEYEGESEFHAWNIVEVDGTYYNLDITWDCRLGEREYFLKGQETFTDHIRDEEFETKDFLTQYPTSEQDFSGI